MPDWLAQPFTGDADLSMSTLVARQVFALVLGVVVAFIYRFTHGAPGQHSRSLMATLVLLTVLIAMMTLVIGDNVARAFSLVGALAIVRFRTVVEDTRDTAFVIFAVSVGMAIGAGFVRVPLVAIPVAGLAAWMFGPRAGNDRPGAGAFELRVRVASGFAIGPDLDGVVRQHALSARLTELSTARQGATLERAFDVRIATETAATDLVAAVNALAGVQSVELKRS